MEADSRSRAKLTMKIDGTTANPDIVPTKQEPHSLVKVGFPVSLAKTSHRRRIFGFPTNWCFGNLGPGIKYFICCVSIQ